MKTKAIFLIACLLILNAFAVKAANWSRLVDLEGNWSFTIGDNPNWSKENVDVSDWDRLYVPANWDEYYKNYNGFGWYRKSFDMRWMPEEGQIALFLGRIDDVDEVFINGVKVGQTGSFFPNFETAYNIERMYYLPKDLLRKTGNVIAVRVLDDAGPGGILSGNRIGIYHDNDNALLSLDLSGSWKFSIFREKNVYETDFDDSDWKTINVPGYWENQGYPNYDGYAWYRKEFTMPDKLKGETLYLVLGRIDDMDKVYLNGEPFARTEYLDDYSKYRKSNSWRLYRVYRIPESRLKTKNVIVVEVRDDQQGGGIYEGPIGIMTARNAEVIMERNDDEFWSNPVDFFFRMIFD